MTNKQLAEQTRKALEEFDRLPPKEQMIKLIASGTINKEGDVMLGREDRWEHKKGLDQLKRDLQIIIDRLNEYAPLRQDAKKKKSAEKMKQYLDAVYPNCQRFKKMYPLYFPESQRLENFFEMVEKCHAMLNGSEKEKEELIDKTDECLTLLRTEVAKLL